MRKWEKFGRFDSKVHGKGIVIGYRSAPEKGDYRGDVLVLREDGRFEIIRNICRCHDCVRTCKLQNAVAEFWRGYAHMSPYPYIPGTRGDWIFRDDLDPETLAKAYQKVEEVKE